MILTHLMLSDFVASKLPLSIGSAPLSIVRVAATSATNTNPSLGWLAFARAIEPACIWMALLLQIGRVCLGLFICAPVPSGPLGAAACLCALARGRSIGHVGYGPVHWATIIIVIQNLSWDNSTLLYAFIFIKGNTLLCWSLHRLYHWNFVKYSEEGGGNLVQVRQT